MYHKYRFMRPSTVLFFLCIFNHSLAADLQAPKMELPEGSQAQNQLQQAHASSGVDDSFYQILQKSLSAVVTLEVNNLPPSNLSNRPDQVPNKYGHSKSFGSGFFISKEGLLITNSHVVYDAQSIVIKDRSGNEFIGQIVGLDPLSDIAVIQSSMPTENYIDLETESPVQIGEPVYAIGSAFDLAQSVSYGIVSALHRAISNPLQDFIQTDSAINQGNSGGPLINRKGQLIGVNTMIITTSGGNNGVGFAIPLSIVKNISKQIIEFGHVKPGKLGVHVQNLSSDMALALGNSANTKGVLISDVLVSSAAESLKLQPKDIITKFNDTEIVSSSQLAAKVYSLREGSPSKIDVIRKGKLDIRSTLVKKIGTLMDLLFRNFFLKVPQWVDLKLWNH